MIYCKNLLHDVNFFFTSFYQLIEKHEIVTLFIVELEK